MAVFILEFEELRGNADHLESVNGSREVTGQLVEVVGDLGPGSREVIREKNRTHPVYVDVEDAAIEHAPTEQTACEVSGIERDRADVSREQDTALKRNFGQA